MTLKEVAEFSDLPVLLWSGASEDTITDLLKKFEAKFKYTPNIVYKCRGRYFVER